MHNVDAVRDNIFIYIEEDLKRALHVWSAFFTVVLFLQTGNSALSYTRGLSQEYRRMPSAASKPDASTSKNKRRRGSLTLDDWLIVFKFIDDHPGVTQTAVVKHFATLHNDPLHFHQGNLSRKLGERTKLEARKDSIPDAFSRTRQRVVTRPDAEHTLFSWVRMMHEKGEAVTGPMLVEKRRELEEVMSVPENERMKTCGWISSFRRA
jgi:hypothetical protein